MYISRAFNQGLNQLLETDTDFFRLTVELKNL